MNKTELIAAVAEKAAITKKDAGAALDAVLAAVAEAMAKGDKVSLVGFGTFEGKKRAARTAKNPQTGKTVKVPASVVPTFKAGKGLKDELNKK